MCAKHFENPTMLSKVTAKNVGDVFLRHTVVTKALKCHDASVVYRTYRPLALA